MHFLTDAETKYSLAQKATVRNAVINEICRNLMYGIFTFYFLRDPLIKSKTNYYPGISNMDDKKQI